LAGNVTEALVEEGQSVEPGQPLLRLDDRVYQHEVALAAAGVRLAEAERERLENGARSHERQEALSLYRAKLAELENAQLAWDRIRQLRAENAIAQQEADNKRLSLAALQAEVAAAKARADLVQAPPRQEELRMASARVDAANARLELARIQLDRTCLKSPLAGRVLQVNLEVGEFTGPDSQKPALVLTDTSRTRVRAFVEELDAARIQLGVAAVVTVDGLPGRQFSGRVVRLSPHMSRKQLFSDRPAERYDTKVREVWIELDEPADLVIGLRVDVTIEAQPIPDPVHSADTRGATRDMPLASRIETGR
jgi:multidrug resistance efflux pump